MSQVSPLPIVDTTPQLVHSLPSDRTASLSACHCGCACQLDRHGAHVMMHSRGSHSIMQRGHGESLTGRIENCEFRYVGQGFRLGRYPIHFHMIGSVRNSYVRKNSIHHTYNRAVAIHGVHYLRVQDNVAFETMGHTYFIEDGALVPHLCRESDCRESDCRQPGRD